jgi:hypothetical protein
LRDEEYVQIFPGLRTDHDEFLVVETAGKYVGLCRKSALLSPPRHLVIMVDHMNGVGRFREAEMKCRIIIA